MLSSCPRSQRSSSSTLSQRSYCHVWCASTCIFLPWCVLLTSPWAFGDISACLFALQHVARVLAFIPLGLLETSPFLVFCAYDCHQPLSYGCWYRPVGTLWFSQPKGMRCICVIHQPLSFGCRATPVGMHCIYVFHQPLNYRCWFSARRHALFLFARGLCAPCLWLCACCWLVANNHSIQ